MCIMGWIHGIKQASNNGMHASIHVLTDGMVGMGKITICSLIDACPTCCLSYLRP